MKMDDLGGSPILGNPHTAMVYYGLDDSLPSGSQTRGFGEHHHVLR